MSMQGGQPKKVAPPKCAKCRTSLGSGPKTVIEGAWHCAACTYLYDHPGAEILKEKRRRALPLQKETLFPLPSIDRDRA